MTSDTSPRPVSPLRARMIEDMTVRGFNERTRGHYVRHVRAFAAFIGRSPDAATAEDLRLFQLHQTQIGMQPPSINGAVSLPRRPCRRPGCEDQEARVATHAAA
jgi:integrase/recombinase XerD